MKALRRVTVALMAVLTLMFATSVPAFAGGYTGSKTFKQYPYSNCDPPFWGSPDICIAWTGGYPTGVARTEDGALNSFYAIKLQVCDADSLANGCAWHTVETQILNYQRGYTASWPTGRNSWFRACASTTKSGGYGCVDATYLGD